MFEDEIDDRLLRRIKAYIGVNKEPSGQYLGHVDNYKGIDIIKYIPPRSTRDLLLVIVGENGTQDWVEFYGDEIENAYDYIDILTEKGKEAADDYWYNFYEEESDERHGINVPVEEKEDEDMKEGFLDNIRARLNNVAHGGKHVLFTSGGVDEYEAEYTDRGRTVEIRPTEIFKSKNPAAIHYAVSDNAGESFDIYRRNRVVDHVEVGKGPKDYSDLIWKLRKLNTPEKFPRLFAYEELEDDTSDIDESADELENVYAVSYTVDEGPIQSIMVRANSEDEAIDKFMKRYHEAFVIGASIEYNPTEMERRGKPMLEELADGIKVHDWYMETFPDDTLGMEINPDITFDDVLKALDDKKDIYVTLDVADSIIRERVFDRLAQLTGMDYDDIYTKWISSEDKEEVETIRDDEG